MLLEPPTVLVAERFLLELEAAVRSFNLAHTLLGCQYLRSDEELFGLVHRVRADLPGVLAWLRQRGDEEADEAMALTLLFFVGHKIGHLLDDADERSYASFIQADAPLETRVANAAMKLCRHVDEFVAHGFDLPMWDQTADPTSEIRCQERGLTSTEELALLRARHERFFADEVSADDAGVRILLEHLARVAALDATAGMRAAALAVNGLFTAGSSPGTRTCSLSGRSSAPRGRPCRPAHGRDVQRAGDVRACRVAFRGRAPLHAPSGGAGNRSCDALAQPVLRCGRADDLVDKARAGRRTVVAALGGRGVVGKRSPPQRFWLLRILMDTAVKISYMGCTTAWMLEQDRARSTPQLFFMTFDSIASAVSRLRRIA